jgi:hypothetical protein
MSIDIMASVALSLILIVYFVLIWQRAATGYVLSDRRISNEMSLLSAADLLISSPGYPENWTLNYSSAESFGIAKTPGVLDRAKVNALAGVPYGYLAYRFSMERDFSIVVEDYAGVRYLDTGAPNNNTNITVQATRVAVMDGVPMFVKVRIHG